MNYGKTIKELRVEKGETQKVFSMNLGITQTYLSQVEKGVKRPSTKILEIIAEYVGTPMPILFWLSADESFVKPEKLESYRLMKPTIDNIIKTFFK